MGKYRVEFKKSTAKELGGLPSADAKRVWQEIGLLRTDPRPRGCQKLSGHNLYRVRCGQYRIIYTIEEEVLTVCIIKVGHRKDVYRLVN